MNNANGGDVIFHFKGDSSNLTKSMSSVGSSVKGMTKSLLVATGVTKAVSAGMNLITSSTGSAVERLDQLNAFPKVMSSLGVSTKKSEKAVKKLSNGLKGLPTTLNQGTTAVSRFVAKNGDVEKSTDIFLALNDAIVAGNASTEIQASALEQMMQAYSKGKPELMEWRSLMTAMPGQLKQVAQAMGYVNTDELYDALKTGEISMDDFMNKIVELDQKGGKGFKSFSEQAHNAVGGIGTAMTNMRTAVARGVANVIDSIDMGLKNAGIESGIAGIIGKIGEGFETGLSGIANYIGPRITGLITGKIDPNVVSQEIITKLMQGITWAFNQIKTTLPTIAPKVFDFISGMTAGLEQETPKIVASFIQLFNKIIEEGQKEENVQKMAEAGTNLGKALLKGIFTAMTENGIKTAFNFATLTMRVPLTLGREMMINIAKGIAEKMGIPKQKADEVVKKIKNAFKDLPKKMLQIGKDIVMGLVKGITSVADKAIDSATNLAKGIGKGIGSVLKINSPSKITKWQGEMTGEGFIKGIESIRKRLQSVVLDTFALSPQLASSTALHYSPNVVVNNNISNNTDPLGQTVTRIKTFANGSKNDYNYGMGV